MKCIFVFHDLKSNKWINPFFAETMHDAIRSVMQTISKPGHFLADFHQDYVLYQTGSLDDDDGRLVPFADPILVAKVSSLMPKGGVA